MDRSVTQVKTFRAAPSAVTRLIDMGVKPFLVASSCRAIMAQRLVRKICPKCKVIKRKGVVRIICTNARHKQRQG